MSFELKGIYPAMPTPFTKTGDVDEAKLRKLTDFCIDGGLDGLFVLSSTGEAVFMSYETKCRCMDIVVEQAAGRVPVVPGVAAGDARECVRLAEHAAELGCPAVVVTPPFFFNPSPASVDTWAKSIIEKSPLPVIIYNIPACATPLTYGNVESLTALPKVIGMKDSSGSMVDFLNYKARKDMSDHPVALFTGREETLFPSLCVGADGCMTATSAVLPEVMVAIYKAYNAGDLKKGLELQMAVNRAISLMASLPFPEGYRTGMEVRGLPMGPCMIPLSPAEQKQRDDSKAKLEKIIPELLASIQ
ncbi:dihydrodipicolinate synthase family protein [Pseudodesulfovibrio thermohalotolerans]|uniref:dihydrodipicolinate synthase family protein n=1 Tax=Pseudodesulfovibrio thermohalotolerans TaxID=2880651 RepID=UPI0024413DDE|nr:dihydrodipicolinate synthase family protein [Pseudodesulfovibrio thermohalotolerans]WFS62326.1 dihydrodipicolinate synthase family protein [Pseudodesulfovibrio thermohalotolerans]